MPVLALLLVIVAAFVIVGIVGWALWLIAWTAFSGLVIGAIGRLILPGRQRIGIIATILCGIGGSLIGGAIGRGFDFGSVITVLIQIGAATAAVGLWSASQARRTPVAASGHHRIIDI